MFATIKKEFILLLRDPAGLLLLLLMPAVLIVVMALVQDAPYRDFQEMRFEIVVVNQDKGTVGKKIVGAFQKSPHFEPVARYKGKSVDTALLFELLQKGKFKIGILIPESATADLVNASNRIANRISGAAGLPARLPQKVQKDSSAIRLFFDPVVKPSSRGSLTYALNQFTTEIKMDILLERLSRTAGPGTTKTALSADQFQVLPVVEHTLSGEQKFNANMNSVQHNVPAWAIFGMFLIVVPFAGNMIRERDEGSAVRVMLIPGAALRTGAGKIVYNILLCFLQFGVMLLVGMFILPLFGLPRLHTGAHPEALAPMVLVIATAAVGFGYFIGRAFKTANQALPFGAIMVVIFSAIGGVWVPIEIMPEPMKALAKVSPLHWGLEGVNQIMLREGGLSRILPAAGMLLLFAVLFMTAGYFTARRSR